MKKAIITILLVVVLGGVAYGAYNYYSVMTSPERELLMAEKNVRELDSYTMEIDLDMDVNTGEDSFKALLSVVTNHDRVAEALYSEVTLRVILEGMALDMDASATYIDDSLYVKIGSIPAYVSMFLPGEISSLVGRDILLVDGLVEKADIFLAEFLAENDMQTITIEELLLEAEDITEKMWRDRVIVVDATEMVDFEGERAKMFTLSMDSEKMIDFYEDMIERYNVIGIMSDLTGEEEEVIRAEMERVMEEAKEDMRSSYEEMEIHAWVVDDYLVRIKFVSDEPLSEDMEGSYAKTVTTINYSNFNQGFEITEPINYITLEELIGLLEGLLDSFIPEGVLGL